MNGTSVSPRGGLLCFGTGGLELIEEVFVEEINLGGLVQKRLYEMKFNS
jgi:hypothetical protein